MSTTKIYGQARRKQRQTEASVRNGDRRPAKKAGQSESQCLRELQDAVATLKVATDSLAVELRLPGKCFAETAVWEGRKRLASALGESSKLGGRRAIAFSPALFDWPRYPVRAGGPTPFARQRRRTGVARA